MKDKYQNSAQQLDLTNSEVKIAKKVFFLNAFPDKVFNFSR